MFSPEDKLLITALQPEARPFIRRLELKRQQLEPRLELYTGAGFALIVTGMGKIPAAIKTSRVLQLAEPAGVECVANLGICGCGNTQTPLGRLHLVNKIEEAATGRAFFPDMLARHQLREAALVTVDQPRACGPDNSTCLYDMEAAGVFQAAASFLSLDRLHFFKVVSDYLSGTILPREEIESLMDSAADEVLAYLQGLPAPDTKPLLTKDDWALLHDFCGALRLTQSQFHQLKDMVISFRLAGGRDLSQRLSCVLKAFSGPTSKAERRTALENLKNALGT